MPMMAIMASLPLASSADSFLVFSAGIRRSQDLPSEVTRSCSSASRLVLGDLAEGHVRQDLSPSRSRHLGDCCQAVGHIRELQSSRWGKVARELPRDLWSNIAHCLPAWRCVHVSARSCLRRLKFSTEPSAVESGRIPKPDRFLHTKLVLEGTQRRSGVVGPVTPGTSGQAVLTSCFDVNRRLDMRHTLEKETCPATELHPNSKSCFFRALRLISDRSLCAQVTYKNPAL